MLEYQKRKLIYKKLNNIFGDPWKIIEMYLNYDVYYINNGRYNYNYFVNDFTNRVWFSTVGIGNHIYMATPLHINYTPNYPDVNLEVVYHDDTNFNWDKSITILRGYERLKKYTTSIHDVLIQNDEPDIRNLIFNE